MEEFSNLISSGDADHADAATGDDGELPNHIPFTYAGFGFRVDLSGLLLALVESPTLTFPPTFES